MYNLLTQGIPQEVTQQQRDAIAHIKENLSAIAPLHQLTLMPISLGLKGQSDICLLAKSNAFDFALFVAPGGDIWSYSQDKQRLRGTDAIVANLLPPSVSDIGIQSSQLP